ncbi:MAG: rod shape-determining protein MreC [Hellea sp.]|nr:rod shape-determining protein MreC [Hellea sp.]
MALVIFLSSRGNDAAFDTSRKQADGIAAKVLTYISLPVRGLENLVSDVRGRFIAHSENERLKAEIARLSDIEARAKVMTIKLSRLENILNVDVGSGIPEQKIAARAVSEIDGPFVRSALINVGHKDGVSEGDAVMTIHGLYGHIVRAGNQSARVLKLEDLNSRIAVMSERTQSRAILVGTNSEIAELAFTSIESDWQDGDKIITSGDDGTLPMGLPVGELQIKENGDLQVILFVNQAFVDWVWVYPYEKMPKPEVDPFEDPEAKEEPAANEALPQ